MPSSHANPIATSPARGVRLARAVIRRVLAAFLVIIPAIAAARDPLGPLTVEEVIGLPVPAGVDGIPVITRGVLTYYEPGHRMVFLQDHTAAIYVHVSNDQNVTVGDYVEVVGFVNPGLNGRTLKGADFNTNPTIRRIKRGTLPEPLLLSSLKHIENAPGALRMRVELQVNSVALEGDRARLNLAGEDRVPVYISGITRPSLLPGHLRGLRVWVYGVLADSVISEKPLVMQRQILVPGLTHIEIPEEESDRAFKGPEERLADLKWRQDSDIPGERTKVLGVVTWIKAGEGFFLQRGTRGAWIQCAEPRLPELSQRVVCAGYPASYHGAGMLRNAMWKESHDVLDAIDALQISEADLSSEQNHGCLVNLRGELVEILRGPSENLMILQVGKAVVFSHLRSAKSQPVPERGSLIFLTGTLLNRPAPMLEFGDSHGSFHILSRTGDDIKVLAAPSFWTLRRMMIALCAALVVTVLAVAWVGALRRKVNQQAALIHQTVAKQVVEEERIRIAREWHDMFEQHFAGLTMLLDATATMIPSDSPAGGMLERAAHMADHSRSEARQAIWDLRDPNHGQNKPFATALEETILRSWPDDTAERLQVQCAEHTVEFPGPITQRLIRIASEAVTNAFKHSECRHITVSWNDDGEAWILAIHDDGKGIPAQAVERASNEGHFGLLGMRERALRLQASLQILSPPAPGIPGTLIRVTLPKSVHKS